VGVVVHPGALAMADDQEAFVAPAVRTARRVLEVGCGRGLLAARLAAGGHDVTGIDVRLPDDRVDVSALARLALVQVDLLGFDAPVFDAVAFTASLHHIAPLGRALDRARALLAPGGVLVVDDFDLEAPDLATLRWYYDQQEVLAAAGAYDPARIDGHPDRDPHDRWRAAHEPHEPHEPPLHAGDAMVAAIEARFDDVRVSRGPYLWRRVARGAQGAHAGAVAAAVHVAEERGVVAGTLCAVGLRVTARRPA
jgi:SAM-dependent methyltransferase